MAVYHSECWHPVHIIHIHSVANAAGLQLPAAQARGTWVALRKRKLQRLHEAYSVIVNIYRERERETLSFRRLVRIKLQVAKLLGRCVFFPFILFCH